MYNKLPTEDGPLIYSKHAEDIYCNKFKKESESGWFLVRKFVKSWQMRNNSKNAPTV